MKKSIISGILVVVILALVGLNVWLIYSASSAKNQEVKNPVLSLELEDYGTVKIELYPEYAPNTVKNVIALANNGYYNGKIFYGMDDIAVYVGRNADGESDNPTISDIDKSVTPAPEKTEEDNTDSDGVTASTQSDDQDNEDYAYEIDGEFVANGFKQNTLNNEKGVVSLVRADYTQQMSNLQKQSYNSGSSQFTISMTDDAKSLNGLYASFGRVVEGMDLVEKIYKLDTKKEEKDDSSTGSSQEEAIKAFEKAPVIKSATVETYGVEYGLPETHEAFDYSAYLQDLMMKYYTNNQ